MKKTNEKCDCLRTLDFVLIAIPMIIIIFMIGYNFGYYTLINLYSQAVETTSKCTKLYAECINLTIEYKNNLYGCIEMLASGD